MIDFTVFHPFPTGIDSFDDLLTKPADTPEAVPQDTARTAPETVPQATPEEIKPGFAYVPKNGFFGVIFGASCSGKSVLSLQLASRFVTATHTGLKNFSVLLRGKADDLKKVNRPHFAVLLSQEKQENIVARAVKGFGFFEDNRKEKKANKRRAKSAVQALGFIESELTTNLLDINPDGDTSKLAILHMPLDPELQQAQLIDVFEFINARFCCEKDRAGTLDDPKQRILIVVDNAETIRTSAFMELMNTKPGTSVPPLPEGGKRAFWKLLREYCNRHRLRTWFSFEEELPHGSQDEGVAVSTAAETYAADAAIHLSVRLRKGGFLERSLEIIKAKDQYYRRGRHHYTIRGFKEGGMGGPSATSDRDGTGIIVFPSMFTQQHRLSRESTQGDAGGMLQGSMLGLANIDKEVRKANPATRLTEDNPGYLCPKTVSVLVSDLDSVGTDVGLHFVGQRETAFMQWMYISFHHEPEMLRKIAIRYDSTRHLEEELKDIMPYGAQTSNGRCLYFPPEHISGSKLLHDIGEKLALIQEKGQPVRVVVDDLFALGVRFPLLEDCNDFMAALFELFRRRNVIALVLDSVEVGEGRNPVEKSLPAGMADHVFLLRHIELQNRTRKVFSVYKLAEFNEPRPVWELERDGAARELRADAGRIQFFKGLISGRPKPVRISLSLYADSTGSPQHRHLQRLQQILSETFGQKIEIHSCHPEDYAVLQYTVGQSVLPVVGDCHIISVDEIWLEQLVTARLVVGFSHEAPAELEAPFKELASTWSPLLAARQKKKLIERGTREFLEKLKHPEEPPTFHWDGAHYVTCAHDLAVECAAIAEAEKAKKDKVRRLAAGTGLPEAPPDYTRRHFAIPDRHNAGVLTYYPRMQNLMEAQGFNTALTNPGWGQLEALQSEFIAWRFAEAHPFGKADPLNYNGIEWHARDASAMTRSERTRRDQTFGVFTFSMENRECCVSFLLELVLSFLKEGENLVDGKRKLQFSGSFEKVWCSGLKRLFSLLDPWDIHRLADCCFRSAVIERPSLYSRQWFTGWGALKQTRPGLQVLELPVGKCKQPTPVSGTWYLAMLAGSSAISAGKAIIQRLTDPGSALYRFNHGIALPVDLELYEGSTPTALRPSLPYRAAIQKQTNALDPVRTEREVKRQQHLAASDRPEPGPPEQPILEHLRTSKCLFHRTTIKDYSSKVSPALMGLIVKAATSLTAEAWLTTRRASDFPKASMEHLVQDLARELR